jgi:hypothetical protein
LQLCLHGSKEEEVTWCIICAIACIRHSTGMKFCETFIRFLLIVRTSIVKMH